MWLVFSIQESVYQKKLRRGINNLLKIKNLPYAIKRPNNTFFPNKNLKFDGFIT